MNPFRTRTFWEKISGEPKTPIEKLGDACINGFAILFILAFIIVAVTVCIVIGLTLPLGIAAIAIIVIVAMLLGAGSISGILEVLIAVLAVMAFIRWIF